jgi:Polysaccharide deacetylase
MPAQRVPGMDHEHYPWSPIVERQRLAWPNDARVALTVVINLETFEERPPEGAVQSANLSGGLGRRPYPDYARLSHREYGHRVGIFRVLDVLERHGVPPTVAIDALTAERYPYLVRHCAERGCEFVAHGISVTQMISSRMREDEEREYISETLSRIEAAVGEKPRGWLGPEFGESERTPWLLADAGLRYVCDWGNDEQPYELTVPGGPLYAFPLMVEYDDAFALWTRGITPATYHDMLTRGFDRLWSDGASNARLLAFGVRPWLIGQPFRIGTLESALAHMKGQPAVWPCTAGEAIDAFASTLAASAMTTGSEGR